MIDIIHQFETAAESSTYGYTPTLWVCVLFLALFGLSTAIHLGQAIHYRIWWLLPTAVLAGLGELIGWSGRLWSNRNVGARDPFLMQITCTIIAPTPLVAANFIILGQLIVLLGWQYSRLGSQMYARIFLTCDLIALVVQAVGGAKASSDVDPTNGGHIMLAGIAFQLAAIAIYTTLASEFVWRYTAQRAFHVPIAPTKSEADSSSMAESHNRMNAFPVIHNARLMLYGLCLSTTVIFIRSVYRVIELSDGWTGRIITTERYFDVLDGGMIVVAMFSLNFFHPGRLIKTARTLRPSSEIELGQ